MPVKCSGQNTNPLRRVFLWVKLMGLNADFQALEPGEKIQLIEVDGTSFGMDKVLRFHAYNIHSEGWASFAADNLPSIIWQGNEYDPHPYEVTGQDLVRAHSRRRLFLWEYL